MGCPLATRSIRTLETGVRPSFPTVVSTVPVCRVAGHDERREQDDVRRECLSHVNSLSVVRRLPLAGCDERFRIEAARRTPQVQDRHRRGSSSAAISALSACADGLRIDHVELPASRARSESRPGAAAAWRDRPPSAGSRWWRPPSRRHGAAGARRRQCVARRRVPRARPIRATAPRRHGRLFRRSVQRVPVLRPTYHPPPHCSARPRGRRPPDASAGVADVRRDRRQQVPARDLLTPPARHRSGRVLRPLPGARPAPAARDPRRRPVRCHRSREIGSVDRDGLSRPLAATATSSDRPFLCRGQRFPRRADRRGRLGVEHLGAKHVELGGSPIRARACDAAESVTARAAACSAAARWLRPDRVRVLRGDAHHQRRPRVSPLALGGGRARVRSRVRGGPASRPKPRNSGCEKPEHDRGLAGRRALSKVTRRRWQRSGCRPRGTVRATPSVRLVRRWIRRGAKLRRDLQPEL